MNQATRINAVVIGIIFAISGMSHGFFEMLQGNTPTNGLIIKAIGAGNSWTRLTEGGEPAFTIISNFLLTGVLAILVSVAIIVWSVGFVHKPRGPFVFLLLFILLFLVGGGIGQVAFFIPAWLVATRIRRPLSWWQKVLPTGARKWFSNAWPWLLGTASLLILLALVFAIFGYMPGVPDTEQVMNITMLIVLMSLGIFLLAFVAGFASDIEDRTQAT